MMVLDAGVLIAHLDADDPHHERARALLVRAAGTRLGASPLTLAEVLAGPAAHRRLEAGLAALGQLGVEAVAFTDQAPAHLALLRAETGLRLPDCAVLLAAASTGGEVATFDEALAGAAQDQGLRVRGNE